MIQSNQTEGENRTGSTGYPVQTATGSQPCQASLPTCHKKSLHELGHGRFQFLNKKRSLVPPIQVD
jgi:hypothetical protein